MRKREEHSSQEGHHMQRLSRKERNDKTIMLQESHTKKSGCLDRSFSLYGRHPDMWNVSLTGLIPTQRTGKSLVYWLKISIRKTKTKITHTSFSTVFFPLIRIFITFFLDNEKQPHKDMRLPPVLPGPVCSTCRHYLLSPQRTLDHTTLLLTLQWLPIVRRRKDVLWPEPYL